MEWLFCLLWLPLSLTILTISFFFHYEGGPDDLFGVYTLVSALLITLLPITWTCYYFYRKK